MVAWQESPVRYRAAVSCLWRFVAGSRRRTAYRCGRSTATGPMMPVRRRLASNGPAPCLCNCASTNFYFIGFLSTLILWHPVVLFYVYLRYALRYDGNSSPITIGVVLAPYSLVVTPQMHYVSPRSLQIMHILYIFKIKNHKTLHWQWKSQIQQINRVNK